MLFLLFGIVVNGFFNDLESFSFPFHPFLLFSSPCFLLLVSFVLYFDCLSILQSLRNELGNISLKLDDVLN